MPSHDLNKALRRKAPPAARNRRGAALTVIAAAMLLACLPTIWIAVVDDPNGGYPVAVAAIEDGPVSTGSVTSGAAVPIEMEAPAIEAPEASVAALPAMPSVGGPESGLIEPSAFGPLPRLAPDGRRPRDAYARRAPAGAPGAPRIAIVVGGLGLSQTGTQRAIEAMPEDITLAFAPLGSSLQRWAEKARGEGHEILLQIPMEPLGYPEENPGEHTLLVSTDRQSNAQDLQWVLGRVTAYAGVMNYMGARFTSDDSVLAPFLGEIGERGLFYLDDGSSPQSRAAGVGGALQVPVLTADAIVDSDRSAGAIERELRLLEATARRRGMAIGVASAFPASVAAIAAWAREAEARGILLVPVSAALQPS